MMRPRTNIVRDAPGAQHDQQVMVVLQELADTMERRTGYHFRNYLHHPTTFATDGDALYMTTTFLDIAGRIRRAAKEHGHDEHAFRQAYQLVDQKQDASGARRIASDLWYEAAVGECECGDRSVLAPLCPVHLVAALIEHEAAHVRMGTFLSWSALNDVGAIDEYRDWMASIATDSRIHARVRDLATTTHGLANVVIRDRRPPTPGRALMLPSLVADALPWMRTVVNVCEDVRVDGLADMTWPGHRHRMLRIKLAEAASVSAKQRVKAPPFVRVMDAIHTIGHAGVPSWRRTPEMQTRLVESTATMCAITDPVERKAFEACAALVAPLDEANSPTRTAVTALLIADVLLAANLVSQEPDGGDGTRDSEWAPRASASSAPDESEVDVDYSPDTGDADDGDTGDGDTGDGDGDADDGDADDGDADDGDADDGDADDGDGDDGDGDDGDGDEMVSPRVRKRRLADDAGDADASGTERDASDANGDDAERPGNVDRDRVPEATRRRVDLSPQAPEVTDAAKENDALGDVVIAEFGSTQDNVELALTIHTLV